MAEMPDVIGGEVISSDWGNDIRDRTVQRYANATERSAEHSAPSPGDFSYLEDTDGVYVWNGSAWVIVVPADGITATHIAANAVGTTEIADDSVTDPKLPDNFLTSRLLTGSAVSEGPDSIPSALTTLTSCVIGFAIPGNWNSWACSVHGHTRILQTADSTSAPTHRLTFQVLIDGVGNEFHSSIASRQGFGGEFGLTNSALTVPITGFRTGMTTTGTRTVTVQRARNGLDNVYTMSATVLVAQAHRLT